MLKHDALHPSSFRTQERVISFISQVSQVIVVFDDLDGFPEEERKDVIKFSTDIVKMTLARCVKVFVTRRREMDIAEAFEDKHISCNLFVYSIRGHTLQRKLGRHTPFNLHLQRFGFLGRKSRSLAHPQSNQERATSFASKHTNFQGQTRKKEQFPLGP